MALYVDIILFDAGKDNNNQFSLDNSVFNDCFPMEKWLISWNCKWNIEMELLWWL